MSNRSMGLRQRRVDVLELCEAWSNKALTVAEVARELGITIGYLYTLAERYALPERPRQSRCNVFDDPPLEEDAASAESLAFSPYVAARIVELKLGPGESS